MTTQGASEAAIRHFSSGYDDDSALDFLRDAYSHEAAKLFHIVGGNDLLPRAFAEAPTKELIYGAPVVLIEQHDQGVRATFECAGQKRTLAADRLICGVPFSALRRVEFQPRLSPGKERAIAELPYGSVTRVYLQLRRRFWLDAGCHGFAETLDLPMEIWNPSHDQPVQRGLQLGLGSSVQKCSETKKGLHKCADAGGFLFRGVGVCDVKDSLDEAWGWGSDDKNPKINQFKTMAVPVQLPTTAENETFGGVTYHIEGELVPALHLELSSTGVYFEHHILLWKDPAVQIELYPMKGAFKRMLAGMPFLLTGARGPGRIAFSRDGAGHVFALHLKPGVGVDVREHQWLAATNNVDYAFT